MPLIGGFERAHEGFKKEDWSLGKIWRSKTAIDGGNRQFIDRMTPPTEILFQAENCHFLCGMGTCLPSACP